MFSVFCHKQDKSTLVDVFDTPGEAKDFLLNHWLEDEDCHYSIIDEEGRTMAVITQPALNQNIAVIVDSAGWITKHWVDYVQENGKNVAKIKLISET